MHRAAKAWCTGLRTGRLRRCMALQAGPATLTRRLQPPTETPRVWCRHTRLLAARSEWDRERERLAAPGRLLRGGLSLGGGGSAAEQEHPWTEALLESGNYGDPPNARCVHDSALYAANAASCVLASLERPRAASRHCVAPALHIAHPSRALLLACAGAGLSRRPAGWCVW
jgi:hypothetical protein